MVSSRNTVSRCHATHCPASPQVYPLACHTDLLLWHVQLLVTSSKGQATQSMLGRGPVSSCNWIKGKAGALSSFS